MPEMAGFASVVLIPDPLTFRELPWSPATGWVLGDLYLEDGSSCPLRLASQTQGKFGATETRKLWFPCWLGNRVLVTRVLDPKLTPEDMGSYGLPPTPPVVEAIARGFFYLVEDNLDRMDEFTSRLADYCLAVKLPLRTVEGEMGPGQLEFTFDVLPGLEAADTISLFRSMAKQVADRMGLHATFMALPGLANYVPSGWHLHQSLVTSDGRNALASKPGSGDLLSAVGRHFAAGLLEHAAEASVFTTPTINGYRRRKAKSLAPDRATWGA